MFKMTYLSIKMLKNIPILKLKTNNLYSFSNLPANFKIIQNLYRQLT